MNFIYKSSAISSTTVWVTITDAAIVAISPGKVSARGSTTRELRVPALKIRALPSDGPIRKNDDMTREITGEIIWNNMYIGITAIMILNSFTTLSICEPITRKSTSAISGTGSHAVKFSAVTPQSVFLVRNWIANANNKGTIIK